MEHNLWDIAYMRGKFIALNAYNYVASEEILQIINSHLKKLEKEGKSKL